MSMWLNYITVAVSLAQFILVIASLAIVIRHYNILRSSSYIERFNSNDMIANRAAVDRWLHQSLAKEDRLKQLSDDPDLDARLRAFANLFEEFGVAYHHHIVHRQTSRELFYFLAPHYWDELRFWIEDLRRHSNPNLYSRFEEVAETLRKD